MKRFQAIVILLLTSIPFINSQVTDIQLLEIAIEEDSLGYFQEIKKSNNELYYVKNPIIDTSNYVEEEKISFKGIDLKIIGILSYKELKKKEKKSIPAIWIEKFILKDNILTSNIKGAIFLYTKKEQDFFFVFSDLLVSFNLNCNTNKWELKNIRNISE